MSNFLYTEKSAATTPTVSPSTARQASLVAGVSLLLMAIIAAAANFGALVPLIAPGDAATTADNIRGSELLFRLGVAGMVVTAILDILVAVSLRKVFEPVNRGVSEVAAWFRLGYTAGLLVAIAQLVSVPTLLDDPGAVLRAIESFDVIWHTSLIFFAVHVLLLGYLALRSGFVPRVFGILLGITGLGYLADGAGLVLVSGFVPVFGQFTFVGEVAIIFWLLIKGGRNKAQAARVEAAA
jgi:hypothetical protein